jgi:hypothetical protein
MRLAKDCVSRCAIEEDQGVAMVVVSARTFMIASPAAIEAEVEDPDTGKVMMSSRNTGNLSADVA